MEDLKKVALKSHSLTTPILYDPKRGLENMYYIPATYIYPGSPDTAGLVVKLRTI
jgi:hypothetical protein